MQGLPQERRRSEGGRKLEQHAYGGLAPRNSGPVGTGKNRVIHRKKWVQRREIKPLRKSAFLGVTSGAMQALGMKQIEKELITLIFIHQVADRKIHSVVSSERGALPLEGATMICESQGAKSLFWAHEPKREGKKKEGRRTRRRVD